MYGWNKKIKSYVFMSCFCLKDHCECTEVHAQQSRVPLCWLNKLVVSFFTD